VVGHIDVTMNWKKMYAACNEVTKLGTSFMPLYCTALLVQTSSASDYRVYNVVSAWNFLKNIYNKHICHIAYDEFW